MLEKLIDEALALVSELDEKAAPLEAKLKEIRETASTLVGQIQDVLDAISRDDEDEEPA